MDGAIGYAHLQMVQRKRNLQHVYKYVQVTRLKGFVNVTGNRFGS